MKHKLSMTRSVFWACSGRTFTHSSCHAWNRRNNGGVSTQNDVEPRPNQMKSWRNNGGVATQYDAELFKRYHSD